MRIPQRATVHAAIFNTQPIDDSREMVENTLDRLHSLSRHESVKSLQVRNHDVLLAEHVRSGFLLDSIDGDGAVKALQDERIDERGPNFCALSREPRTGVDIYLVWRS